MKQRAGFFKGGSRFFIVYLSIMTLIIGLIGGTFYRIWVEFNTSRENYSLYIERISHLNALKSAASILSEWQTLYLETDSRQSRYVAQRKMTEAAKFLQEHGEGIKSNLEELPANVEAFDLLMPRLAELLDKHEKIIRLFDSGEGNIDKEVTEYTSLKDVFISIDELLIIRTINESGRVSSEGYLRVMIYLVIEIIGLILVTVALFVNILQRERIGFLLRRTRSFLNNIVNSMPSALVGVDRDGVVTHWNQGAEELSGVPAERALGHPLFEVFPRLAEQSKIIEESISSMEVRTLAKVPCHQGNDNCYEDITIFPLTESVGEGAVIRLDNVTERMHLEEVMIQSEKMLTLGGMAAGMAHELNNPIAGMMQNAQVILRRMTGDMPANERVAEEVGTTVEAVRSFLEKRKVLYLLSLIFDAGLRASQVVQNMLSFARKSDSKYLFYSLEELLDMTVELAQNDYDLKKRYDFRKIKITREYEKELPAVRCDKSKLQQVFFNLLKNGAEAMTDERKSNPYLEKESAFIFRIKREEEMVRIEVEDNGPGIPDEALKHIFEPFFTTKEPGKGTGLGLSVSYFIITKSHAGRMEVESGEGEGTKFIITLPVNFEVEEEGGGS